MKIELELETAGTPDNKIHAATHSLVIEVPEEVNDILRELLRWDGEIKIKAITTMPSDTTVSIMV